MTGPDLNVVEKPKITVMLAKSYDPDKDVNKVDGWWMSIKYDGVRGKWNGEYMESRSGKTYELPVFVIEQLMKIKDVEGNPMQLDGEIWFGNDTFSIASGEARKSDKNKELWKKNMTYNVFDTPIPNVPFEDRLYMIKDALTRAKKTGKLPNIKMVKQTKFDPKVTTIQQELENIEKMGGEGLMLRKPGSLYVSTRSDSMLKVKSWSFKDCIVTGYEEGKGRLASLVGSLFVETDEFIDEDAEDEDVEDGSGAAGSKERAKHHSKSKSITFKVGSGLNDEQRYSGVKNDANWKDKKIQTQIDNNRRKQLKNIDKSTDEYKQIIKDITQSKTQKERSDALHKLNALYVQIPVVETKICFKYKELTKYGKPSMPTFVCCRDDYEHE